MDPVTVEKVVISPSQVDSALADPIRKCITVLAERVRTRAVSLVPVDTGRLKSSITVHVDGRGKDTVGLVGSNVEYAAYVELGTFRTRAQPYLVPALDAARGKV